jgi:hypothetical protein
MRGKTVRLTLLVFAALASTAHASPSWTELSSGTTNIITAVEYQSDSRMWFTTSAGEIFTRQPSGAFVRTYGPGTGPLNDIEFQDQGLIGLAVGNNGQVLRSPDGGATWSNVNTGPAIPVSKTGTLAPDCTASDPLGDVNAVRFAGTGRAWLFAAGSQIARSQPASAADVGKAGTWVDANRAGDNSCKVRDGIFGDGYADGFFLPTNPDVGYIVAASFSTVFFTVNDLATEAGKRPESAGNAGDALRVLAGDPSNPSRMWSVAGAPYGISTTGYTEDGFSTEHSWAIGNPSARAFTANGPYDVAFKGGTVLSAGDDGMVLNSIDGRTFYFEPVTGALPGQGWRAVALADASHGAVAGAGGKLFVTTSANSLPDLTAPTGTIAGPDTATAGVPASFAASATDEAGGSGIDDASFAWSSPGVTGAAGQAVSLTFPSAGSYTVTVAFKDRAGNAGTASKSVTVTPAIAAALPKMRLPKKAPAKATIKGKQVRFAIKGRLTLPSTVAAAQGCKGTVTLQIRKGTRTRASKKVKLSPGCVFRATITVKRSRLGTAKPKLRVAFGGNAAVGAAARTYTVKIRR